jgi:hypothetical protein
MNLLQLETVAPLERIALLLSQGFSLEKVAVACGLRPKELQELQDKSSKLQALLADKFKGKVETESTLLSQKEVEAVATGKTDVSFAKAEELILRKALGDLNDLSAPELLSFLKLTSQRNLEKRNLDAKLAHQGLGQSNIQGTGASATVTISLPSHMPEVTIQLSPSRDVVAVNDRSLAPMPASSIPDYLLGQGLLADKE